MENKEYFPLFIPTSGKKVVVIGGGNIAERRIKTLLKFNFSISVISRNATQEIIKLNEKGEIIYTQSEYKEEYIKDCFMVLACTDDAECNRKITEFCKKNGIYANSCSDKSLCDFFFPAVITDEYVTIGLAGSGDDHTKTRQTADKIREVIKGDN